MSFRFRLIVSCIALGFVFYAIRYLNTAGVEKTPLKQALFLDEQPPAQYELISLNAASGPTEPTTKNPMAEPAAQANGGSASMASVVAPKSGWEKVRFNWCGTRVTDMEVKTTGASESAWSLKEDNQKWVFKPTAPMGATAAPAKEVTPVEMEKWLSRNCFLMAFQPKEGLGLKVTPSFKYSLLIKYADQSNLVFNSDGMGLFEQSGHYYFSKIFEDELRLLALGKTL